MATESASLDFFFRLCRAYSTLTRRFDSSLGSFHGLSFADFMLLSSLGRAPGTRLRRVDLAERLGLTASGVTRALIPLEKIGLVKRQPDPRDARIGYAVLTPAGAKLLANASESAAMVSDVAVQAVPARQLEAFSALLGQLAGMNATNS
jgi:DNA-binding MarR family transcriptional regulator